MESAKGFFTEVKSVIADAEEHLRAAAATTGEKATELRDKALTNLRRAKESLQDAQAVVVERGKAVARVTDDYVHDHPWRAIGIAAAVGFLLGLLVNRK